MEDAKPATATILFADVVGSTARRSLLGEERADELRRVQDRLLEEPVRASGGVVVKYLGDGIMAAFTAASDALAAAVAMQQAVAAHNRNVEAPATLSIRVGLSTGDVAWDDSDCFGTPVVEAARLEAAAAPSQILCSELVPMMARGRGGHEFRPLGFLELKGLPEPVAVSELLWAPPPAPGLPFPPELAARPARQFVSRAAELAAVERILADPGRARAVVVWIVGEPGIGKTRLATEIARRAHQGGAVVLFGRCSQDIQVPHQPVVEALRWYVGQLADDQLPTRLGALAGELTRLIPELDTRLPGAKASRSTSANAEQHHLFEAVRSWLAAAGQDHASRAGTSPGTVVFVVDDVHWAAGTTIALLGHVARSLEPSKVVLVCTARTTSPDASETLADLADELVRQERDSHRIELGGLEVEDIGCLVSSAAGRSLDGPLSDLAAQLQRETAGNPLFVDALLAALGEEDGWIEPTLIRSTGEVPVPRRLAETVARRVSRLGPETGEVLRVASVAGLTFDIRVVAHATGRGEMEVVDVLDRASKAGLVEEASTNHCRFTHALVRSVLRDDLSRARRARVHLLVAEALESLPDTGAGERAAELAHHFGEAVPVGAGAKACRYFLAAARLASQVLCHQDAANAYERALELVDELPEGERPRRGDLLFARGQAQFKSSDFTAARATLKEAARAFTDAGDAHGLAEVAVTFDEASVRHGFGGEETLDLARRALMALPAEETPLRARVMASEARALGFIAGRAGESVSRGREALACARRVGDPATIADVLRRTSYRHRGVEQAEEAAQHGREMLRIAEHLDDDDLRAWASLLMGDAAAMLGDLSVWDRLMAEEAHLIEVVRQPFFDHGLLLRRHLRAVLAGDLVLAEHLLERATAIGAPLGWALEGLHGIGMFFLRREQGRVAGLARALKAVVDEGVPLWRPGLAAAYAEAGMTEEARAEYEALAAGGFTGVPDDDSRLLSLGLLIEVCVSLGSAEQAPFFLDVLRPCGGRLLLFPGTGACLGPTDRLRARLAALSGNSAAAAEWFEEALLFSRRLGSPLWTAHCLHDLAAHLAGTEPTRAGALLGEAAALCRRHQLAGLGQRVSALRHRA